MESMLTPILRIYGIDIFQVINTTLKRKMLAVVNRTDNYNYKVYEILNLWTRLDRLKIESEIGQMFEGNPDRFARPSR